MTRAERTGRLARVLSAGHFAVTSEVVPPRSADGAEVKDHARGLVGYVDAANVTDNPRASAHMSAVAGAAFLARTGIEPILQVTTRDRNSLAITSDLLAAWALGARGMLCLAGDPVAGGDHPDAREVYELSTLDLIRLVAGLRDRGESLSGRQVDAPPRFLIGVADAPLADGYDPARLEAKLDAGADFVQTQITYDLEALGEWADTVRSRGVLQRTAVLIGVSPLRSVKSARFMNEELFGVTVPQDAIGALEEAGPDAEAVGLRMAIELVQGLRDIEGIRGVHIMSLGHDDATRAIVEGAGLFPRPLSA